MANGFEMYEEYKKKKNQTPTIKVPTPVVPLPVVTPEAVYKQSNNPPSVKVPGGSLPKQYGVGFNKPTPIPESPFKNKVSPFLPPAGTTPKVKTNLGYISGQLPLQVNVPTPAQTYKDKAAALKEQIAAQQKALTPYRGVSSSMMAATQTQAQSLPKGVSSMGLPMTTVVKPQRQAAVEQTIANLKGELAQAQNAGYAADYSQQWAALNKRTDANYIKARLARMATLRDSFGSDHSQNVGAMTEYQRIRGELEKLGVNAEGLSDWLQRNSDYLEAAQEMAESQQYATEKPLRASLASVGKNLVSGQGALAGIAQQGMNTSSGEYRPINVYGDAFDASREKQTIRGTVGENIAKNHGQAAKFLYDIGMSMADSGATALTAGLTGAGGAASIILGSAVASDTMMNVVERGGSTDQAVTAGVLAGAAETIFESISLGKFLDTFKSAGAKSAKEIAKNALLQGVTEMSEEMATEVSNIIVDEVVMGSLSELNQMRANGATEAQITGEIAKRIGLAGLGGFLSGGIFGTVGSLNNRTENPTVTRREQRALDALSKKTGVNIQIDDDIKGSNGYFDRKTNTLHISRNSNNAVYQVAAHEITHSFESNPEEWNQLYEIANANLSAEARANLEDLLKVTGYTDSQMQSEVVSHYVQQCVTDIKSFEQLVGVNRTLAQRIVDAFESFVRKLTGQQNIGSWQETAQLREFIGDITPEQAQQTLAQMKKALGVKTEGQTGEAAQSLKMFDDGVRFVDVDVDQQLFDGLSEREQGALATKIIKERFAGKPVGNEFPVFVNGRSAGEFGFPVKKLEPAEHDAKMRTAPELDNLFDAGSNYRKEPDGRDGHVHKDVVDGFSYFDTIFKVGDEYYQGTVNVKNVAKGRLFKDLTKIKNITKDISSSYGETPKSTILRDASNYYDTQNEPVVNTQKSLKLSPEEIKQNADTAEQYFGTTISPKTAGYLTVNGRMLDFSGRKFGAPGYSRTMDHREITDAFGNDYGGDGYSDGMIQFMAEGNIRLAPESGGIDLCVKPNELQEIQLQRYIRTFGGEVVVDFSRENGDIDGSVEYPARTPASLILQEIRDYFDKGKMPENFDYSRKLNFEGGRKLAEQRTGRGLPYNPNTPKTIPQNPAQGKFGGNTVGAAESNPNSYSALQNRHGTIKPGENPSRLVDVPKKDAEGNVVSLFARTGMESKHLPDELVEPMEQAVASGEFSHVVASDKKAMSYAEGEVKQGFSHAWKQWRAVADGSKVATKDDIALGELLLANAMKDGNVGLAIQLTAELCAEATRAGQNVQAFRLLKKMTPEGMLYYLQKTADNISKEFSNKKGFDGIKLDENLVAQLANAKTQQEMEAATEALEQNIADQVPANFWDIMNAWRYLSMLGNPTTHIRNILGNLFFAPVINMKNGVAQALESVLIKDGERQKSIVWGASQADKALLDFAKKDYESEGTSRLHDDKYATTKGNIMARRQVLPGILGKVAEWNSNLLSKEDQWFSKPRYVRSLASYMKANGLTAENITPEQLTKARDYAVQEAQRATYQDDAALANLIKGWKNKAKSYERHGNIAQKAIGYASEAFIDSIMPFTKTPVNIVKRALEYSPVNLVNVVANAVQIKQGKATAADLINNFASAFTGTSLAALGYMLAKIGWVTGAGEEDKEDKYRQTLGEQNYSLNLGAMMHDLGRMVGVEFDEEQLGTYTIDWLAPEALVFFTGVAIAEDVKLGELNPNEILDALSAMGDPIVELSMMSGLNDALTSVQHGNNALSALFSNQISSYLSQYVPTIGGKFARTIDETNRQTYYDPNKKGLYKAADVFAQKAAQKIPFASKLLQPRIDVWGRESENVGGSGAGRFAYNMLSPGYYKGKTATDVDNELLSLYEKTGEASVLPTTAAKTFKLPQDDGGETIRLNAEDYTTYAKVKGQTAYDIFDDMIGTKEYKALNSAERAEVASKVYQYANAVAKTKVSNYTLTDTNRKIYEAEKVGVEPGEYLSLWIKYDADNNGNVTQDEVKAILDSSKLTDEQKAVVWQLQNSRWEEKNNPYTKRTGNRR